MNNDIKINDSEENPIPEVVKPRSNIWFWLIQIVLIPIIGFLAVWFFNQTNNYGKEITKLNTDMVTVKGILESDKIDHLTETITGIKKDIERIIERLNDEEAQWDALKDINDKVTSLQIEVEVVRRLQMMNSFRIEPTMIQTDAHVIGEDPKPNIDIEPSTQQIEQAPINDLMDKIDNAKSENTEEYKKRHVREFNMRK